MKFLCGNCKAKYQIADEKISGRTLRMKCRKCSHDIIIRGESVGKPAAPAPRPGAPQAPAQARRAAAPRPQPAPRAAAPSALGADFRRNVARAAQPAVAPPPPVELLWHVAINDVPVGPIRKEEVGRKISTGAVNKESLCWREGFDDWRPLGDVPELSALLRRPPPAPVRPAPVGRGIGARGGSRPRMRSVAPRTPPPASESSRPAARSNVVPIGGRLGAQAGSAVDESVDEEEATKLSAPLFEEIMKPPDAPGPAPTPPPAQPFGSPSAFGADQAPDTSDDILIAGLAGTSDAVASAPAAIAAERISAMPSYAPPRRRGLPVGAWIAIAGAVAFGAMLALMVGTKLLFTEERPEIAEVIPSVAEEEPAEQELVTEVEDPGVDPTVEEEVAGDPEAGSPRGGMRVRGSRATMMSTGSTKMLTAAERALLERFGMDTMSSSLGMLDTGMGVGSMGGPAAQPLNAQQLGRVVSRNRPSLQRCYETSIRGMSDAPSVRLDVAVTVGISGRVTRVTATPRGQTLPGLSGCVRGAVNRWTFPSAGAASRLNFPVVFTSAS